MTAKTEMTVLVVVSLVWRFGLMVERVGRMGGTVPEPGVEGADDGLGGLLLASVFASYWRDRSSTFILARLSLRMRSCDRGMLLVRRWRV
jgi:hypothetical protein